MDAVDLADAIAEADPVPVVLAFLKTHPRAVELMGGDTHVTGIRESPWPHLAVGPGLGGDLRELVWNTEQEVELKITGAPDGAPGISALRKTMMRLLVLLTRVLPEQDAVPGEPVVARVRPSGVMADSTLSTGQPEFTSGVLVVMHPPIS